MYTKEITGPTGRRVTGYAVIDDSGQEIRRFPIKNYGYWRFAKEAAQRFVQSHQWGGDLTP